MEDFLLFWPQLWDTFLRPWLLYFSTIGVLANWAYIQTDWKHSLDKE